MENKVFEFEPANKLKSYIESAMTNTVARISTAQKGERNNTLSSQTFSLASVIAGARAVCNDLNIDDLTVKSKLILTAKSMNEPLPENEIQSTVVNSYLKGINSPKSLNPDDFDIGKQKKVQIRLIDSNSTRRFIHKDYSSLSLRKARRDDIVNIEKHIKKRYSLDTLEKLGVKISEKPYGMVFTDSRLITYNPNSKNEYLVLEGRTDFITAVELGLDNDFGLVSRYNKERKIELGKGTYYFVLDSDETAEHIESLIIAKETARFTCIRPASEYKDLSEWFFNQDEIAVEIRRIVDTAELKAIIPNSNFSKNSNFSNFSKGYCKNDNILEIYNGTELQSKEFAELEYVVNDLLPYGYWILAGKPKHGKSFLALQLLLSVANGAKFLNHFDTKKGKVLYISLEDSERRIKQRANKIKEHNPELILNENFFYTIKHITLDDNGIELLRNEIRNIPDLKLIVIDTLGRVKENASSNNIYLSDYKFGAKVQNIAKEFNVTIIAITHLRKNYKFSQKDDVFEEIMGSSGEISAADGQNVLHKIGKTSGKLFVRGRDIDEMTLQLEFDSGFWKFVNYIDDEDDDLRATSWKTYFIADRMTKKELVSEMAKKGINDKTAYYRIKMALKNEILKDEGNEIKINN